MITHINTNILKHSHETKKLAGNEIVVNAAFNDFDEFLMSYVSDVPGGGLFVKTTKALPLGSRVRLFFTLKDSRVPILEGDGEIISVEREDLESVGGMVIKFYNLNEKSKALLSRLVKNFL
ncbi:MAG: PilZ domain-containing protein [Deltaproteobacteria bacterium]|nr:PilZ domain-containing protein [Deltaproteobacteria bacterium]